MYCVKRLPQFRVDSRKILDSKKVENHRQKVNSLSCRIIKISAIKQDLAVIISHATDLLFSRPTDDPASSDKEA